MANKKKIKIFLLGTWCHPLMWPKTQSTVKKKVIIDFAVRTIFANFQEIAY